MSRISPTLSALKAQNRKALIPFVTAGFPYADVTPAHLSAAGLRMTLTATTWPAASKRTSPCSVAPARRRA